METREKNNLTKILKNNTHFKNVIEKLTTDSPLNYQEKSFILASSLLFLKEYDKDKRYKSYADIAYYIILKYSVQYKDYKPLYDFSTIFGFYPISSIILENNLIPDKNLSDLFVKIQLNGFKKETSMGKFYVETFEQKKERNSFISDISNEKGFIAPTSFGKSTVIIELIKLLEEKCKIAIIVPTKSLLMQTYKMIRDEKLNYRILIHDEMYRNEDNFIGIFTQERALRLLKNKQISYDILIIDEAHNILDNNHRSILISRLLKINKSKNSNQKVIYLSPLINDIENIKTEESQQINTHRINFNIKSPEIYEYKINNCVVKHNKFFINDENTGYYISEYNNYFSFLKEYSGSKNFLYNYRPKHIEHLAKDLIKHTPIINNSSAISDVINILKTEVHEMFYCINLLKHGIIYLHGKLPDLVKEYLEKKFNDIDDIKFVVANSVILEGINLPIDRLFIFNTRGLQGKELTNLIGRVNRLNEIFKGNNNLDKLLPKIHFVNNILYNALGDKNVDMFNKIKELRNRTFSDSLGNPLLNKFEIEKIKDSDNEKQIKKRDKIKQLIEYEEFLITKPKNEKERLKQYLIENGFNLFYNDLEKLTKILFMRISETVHNKLGWHNLSMLDKINQIFIVDFVKENDIIIDFEFYRLKELKARNYYEMHIENRKKSLRENINNLFIHLKKRRESKIKNDVIYYIGPAYGEIKYTSNKYFNELKNSNVAINLSRKTDEELINYAIVKLKIEDDFISFKLNKFIVFLFDYKLISLNEYHTYIYGTTNEKKIELTKFGLNIGLIDRLQKDNQLQNLGFDNNNNLTSNEAFNQYLNKLNDFQRFEIERYIV